jgi:hypothetical protein
MDGEGEDTVIQGRKSTTPQAKEGARAWRWRMTKDDENALSVGDGKVDGGELEVDWKLAADGRVLNLTNAKTSRAFLCHQPCFG